MAILTKTMVPVSPLIFNQSQKSTKADGPSIQLDSKLRVVKRFADSGDYLRALAALPTGSSDHEVHNCRGVCLMRMNKFEQAIAPLRFVALETNTLHLRSEVANHIKINFATALFFGGQPAGGLSSLSEINLETDPAVIMIRNQTKQWEAGMSFFRRVDWYLSRIAPKQGPVPPAEPVGRFIWDLDGTQLVKPKTT